MSNGNDDGLNEKGTVEDPDSQKWLVYGKNDNSPKSSSCLHGFIHHTETPFLMGQLSNQGLILGRKFTNKFTIPDMNNPYEQEKLRGNISKQANNVTTKVQHTGGWAKSS